MIRGLVFTGFALALNVVAVVAQNSPAAQDAAPVPAPEQPVVTDGVTIPVKALRAGWKAARCTVPLKDEPRSTQTLGGTLRLVAVGCWSDPPFEGRILYAVDPAVPHKAKLLKFRGWNGKRFVPAISLTDPSYDAATMTLGSAQRSGGKGDCGSIGVWRFVDGDFKMIGFWHKAACDGTPFDDDKRWQVFPKPQS